MSIVKFCPMCTSISESEIARNLLSRSTMLLGSVSIVSATSVVAATAWSYTVLMFATPATEDHSDSALEYVTPVSVLQSTQSVASSEGCWPGMQGWRETPALEYWPASHARHSVWLGSGCLPALQG